MIDQTTTLHRADSHLNTELDEEVIVMSLGSGRIFSFVDTAREIWAMLAQEMTFGQLIDHLVAEFDVSREVCAADVTQFLDVLIEHKMVEIKNA